MAVHTTWISQALTTYLTGKTIKALVVTSAYIDDETHQFRSSLVEANGTGYTAGGVTVTGVVVSLTSGAVVISCADVAFGDVDLIDAAGVAFYVSTGSAAADTVLVVDMFSDPVDTSTSPEFTYQPNPSGLVVAAVPA